MMFRGCHKVLAKSLAPQLVLASGLRKTEAQKRKFAALSRVSLLEAFPELASMWCGLRWGSTSCKPSDVSPTCAKLALWRCSACDARFPRAIPSMVYSRGECPQCGALPSTHTAKATTPQGEERKNYERAQSHNTSLIGRNIQPMLAQTFGNVSIEDDEVLYASPKIDGFRCLVAFDEGSSRLSFISRRGTVFESCDSLEPLLLPLFAEDPKLILDGELFLPGVPFETVSGALRSKRSSANAANRAIQERLQYHAFDVLYSGKFTDADHCGAKCSPLLSKDRSSAQDVCYAARLRVLTAAFPLNSLSALRSTNGCGVYRVPAILVTKSRVYAACVAAEKDGFEGVMLRRNKFGYDFGKRSMSLLKFKRIQDSEFAIKRACEGVGRFKGKLGSFVCDSATGIEFFVTPSVTLEVRRELWNRRDELVGKMLTVQYQELSRQGVPRFPIGKCVRGSADGRDWF